MLNERLEFEAYMTNDPRDKKSRLQPNYLTDNFGKKSKKYELRGLDQILTVIARGFIFSCLDKDLLNGKRVIADEEIATVKYALNRWCGFKIQKDTDRGNEELVDELFKQYPYADGFLKNFWECHQAKCEGSKLTWDGCEKVWSKKYNSEMSYMAESVNFDNIIASALEAGPLRERLCVIKKPDDEMLNQILKKPDALYDYLFTEYEGNPQKKTKNKLLRNIIAFLLLQNEESEKAVLLQKLRLFGWYGSDDTDGKQYRWYFDSFWFDSEKIMLGYGGSDYVKYGINEKYLQAYNFRIIDKKDEDKYIKDYLLLEDPGYGNIPFICKTK